MRKCFLLLLVICLHSSVFSQGIYNYSITTVKDSVIHLSSYQGKQLLIVNTSLSGSRVVQYSQLDTLSRLYKDSNLVIIAIGTNAFDSTLTSNGQLLTLYNSLHLSYPLGKLVSVKGSTQDPLYQWLTQQSKNGVMDTEVTGDFFKFLIDGNGAFKGQLTGRVTPLEPSMITAIHSN